MDVLTTSILFVSVQVSIIIIVMIMRIIEIAKPKKVTMPKNIQRMFKIFLAPNQFFTKPKNDNIDPATATTMKNP